jgi:hypothetical protein
MSLRTTLTIAVLTLVLSGTAHAAVLFTPPLDAGGTSDKVLECHIVNVHHTTSTVRIQVLDINGNTIRDTGTFPLLPGQASLTAGDGLEAPWYCKFTVSGTGTTAADKVRASAVVRGGTPPVTTATVPAR